MNDDEKIKEIVQARWCLPALRRNILSRHVLINWLSHQGFSRDLDFSRDQDLDYSQKGSNCGKNILGENKFEEDMDLLIAYRNFCQEAQPEDHFVEGKHITIIMTDICFMLVFLMVGGSVETPAFQNTSVTIVRHRAEDLARIYKSSNDYNIIKILCNLEKSDLYTYLNLVSRPALDDHGIKSTYKSDLLKINWTEAILEKLGSTNIVRSTNTVRSRPTTTTITQILNHCVDIAARFTWLWRTYLANDYYQIFHKIFFKTRKDKGIDEGNQYPMIPPDFCKVDFDRINVLFPGLFSLEIKKLDRTAYNIYKLPNNYQKAYLLGYPIHFVIPSGRMILERLTYLSQHGVEQFVGEMQSRIPKLVLENYDCPLEVQNYGCDYNVLNDFLPFDVISYVENDVLYRFTRSSFNQILKNYEERKERAKQSERKERADFNVPECQRIEIKKRLLIIKKYNLPTQCKKWSEMLAQY